MAEAKVGVVPEEATEEAKEGVEKAVAERAVVG